MTILYHKLRDNSLHLKTKKEKKCKGHNALYYKTGYILSYLCIDTYMVDI